MNTKHFRVGVAELDISCEIGVELAGELDPRLSTGVETSLLARALILEDGAERLAIVMLDLYGLQESASEQISQAIADQNHMPPEAVMLVCSHTRGGPYTAPVVGRPDINDMYLKELARKLPEVVAQAATRLEEASLGVVPLSLPHLAYNHRLLTRNMKAVSAWLGVPKNEVLQPEGPIDPGFWVVVMRDRRGAPLCLLWNYAADPRFPTNGMVSGGLPALVQQEVDARLGSHIPLFYLPGCGGNVSYTRSLDETVDAISSAVIAGYLEGGCDPSIQLAKTSEKMVLPIRDYSCFWSQPDIELKAPMAVEAFAREIECLQHEGAQAIPARIQAFRLGPVALVGLPGYPFVEFALKIKEESPVPVTLVVGNAGGHLGYVITQQAFESGGFEAWTARSAKVGPGGGEFMAEEAVKLIQDLWKADGQKHSR